MEVFSEKDLKQIKDKNITIDNIKEQLNNFEKRFPFIKLVKPATVGDGVVSFSEEERLNIEKYFDDNISDYETLKFVPASGAASRMFEHLLSFMQKYTGSKQQIEELENQKGKNSVKYFFQNIEKFAFYPDLKKVMRESGYDIKTLIEKKYYRSILEFLLTADGLNYAAKPKALLKFHSYEEHNRMSMEEHLAEGAHYTQNNKGKVKLHFTVSPEHLDTFKHHMNQLKVKCENQFKVSYNITYSIQKSSTDTIAVNLDNTPFRDSNDNLLFRPGGHGALIENLIDLDSEIIFIKNIDNVVPDKLKSITYTYKKVIGGYIIQLKEKLDDYVDMLDEGNVSTSDLEEIRNFAETKLNISNNKNVFDKMENIEKIDLLYNQLNRPVRICGMVKNEGEPGGGPFWVRNSNGRISLQIVEGSQIDSNNEEQKTIASHATHFNPVDLVCAIKDFKEEKFDLKKFIDPTTGFISKKSKDGKILKAQELPGLWNGAMAEWITIFVEVPIETFNPVKTVNDLLRPNHQ
ncbi:MAG: DUF4301 family protein [Bacteroidota bacterium]|nr:DUF4301 family protein [Bacteroidota bacterium]